MQCTGVEKPITDMEMEEMVCPKSVAKSNASQIKDNHVNTSYANALNQKLDNKLTLILTVVGDDDPSVSLERIEPTMLPLWVKFKNLPLKAWSAKWISTIAIRLGNPLIMDQVTTQMCNLGNGIAGFVRVLIKVKACKGLPDQIEIVYKIIDNMETRRKYIKVGKNNGYMLGVKKDNVTYQPVKRKVDVEGSKGNSSEVQETKKSIMCNVARNEMISSYASILNDSGGEAVPFSTNFMDVNIDCVNWLKIDDVASIGLYYSWAKSLLNPNSSIPKKINRVMGNEEFFDAHRIAHVVFLPYGISDHSPAVSTCSKARKSSLRSFREVTKEEIKDDMFSIDDIIRLLALMVKVIKSALEDFSKVSGLHPNLKRNTIFCGNMDNISISSIEGNLESIQTHQSSESLDFEVLIVGYEHVVMNCGSAGIRFGWSNLQIRED
nr:RNA-directed DNA polymerase, eukaryota, reverse transcriptase zinc-binding domain protein [Tanacetum cinerariifolium]